MLSIISAIYNQLSMNKLFYEYLVKYTSNTFELIIIDNGSTDGSVEYFEKQKNVKVVKNDGNYSYPYCQNIGIRNAQYDILCFFNNDIVVSPAWDEKMLAIMKKNNLEIVSCVASDVLENKEATRLNLRKWKRSKNPLIFLFGAKYWNLKLMLKIMYGNWEKYCQKRFKNFGETIKEGISGSNVIATRQAMQKIGNWDERMQSADFDIFLKTKERNLKFNDLKPVHQLLGVYIHHYSRLTMKNNYPRFKDYDNLISVKQKWGEEYARELLKDTYMEV